MTTTSLQPISGPAHDVLGVLTTLRCAVGAARGTDIGTCDADVVRAALLEITALKAQLAELELSVLQRGEAVSAGRAAGAPSTATWLAIATGQSSKAVHARARLAAAVDEFTDVRDAMARGDVLPEQAEAIVEEARRLPGDTSAAVDWLIRRAARDNAAQLRIAGRQLALGVEPAAEAADPRPTAVIHEPPVDASPPDEAASEARPTEPHPSPLPSSRPEPAVVVDLEQASRHPWLELLGRCARHLADVTCRGLRRRVAALRRHPRGHPT